MSIQKQLSKVETMYSENLKKMGSDDSRAVGWNTEECQKLRFSKLTSVINADEPFSINDLGCGYGALLPFIVDELGCKVKIYNGYDISENMLSAARQRLNKYNGSSTQILLYKEPILKDVADYSIVSGTFNVKFDSTNEEWSEYIKNCLQNLDEKSTKGFSFNLLTSYVDWQEEHLYYADPCYWFDYCKKNFSKKVSLYHDYPLYEWTIIVKKEES